MTHPAAARRFRVASAAAMSLAIILVSGCDRSAGSAPGAKASVTVTAAASGAVAPAASGAVAPAASGVAAPARSPLETRKPNAPHLTPERPDQTRAPGVTSGVPFSVQLVAGGLDHPWAVEPLPGGDLVVTEKPGRMRIVTQAGAVGAPLSGVPRVDARGQGGLLDIATSPAFDTDRTIFWSYAEPREGGNGTSVARGVLSSDRTALEDVTVIFRAQPTYDGTLHYGSRIVFAPDGNLHVTLGERSDEDMRAHAQRLDSHMGKTLRIRPDGSAPLDNPFVGQPGALPEIWTLGQRNVQAAAFDAQGRLWSVDHGPQGGDELNLLEQGRNYGWPLVSYGEEYSGRPLPGAVTSSSGYISPVYYWDPVIAPSGAQFHSGVMFPEWKGNLFVGALREARLVRLVIEGDRVVGEEHLMVDRGRRVRDVRQGPDGALYVVTDEPNGELLRIVRSGS